ncbi:MAG: hypothetical protein JNG84_15480 [Archangium sp.]|nr:hypothetical protein [Archangium sp.]
MAREQKPMRAAVLVGALLALPAVAQDRPAEADLFGTADEAVDAGVQPSEATIPATTPAAEVTISGDEAQLSSGPIQNKFDSAEVTSDPIKVGANLLMSSQFYWQEGPAFEKGSVSAPFILDTFIDGRPNDRLRAFAVGRLQFDPTRPLSTGAAATTTTPTGSLVGLTPASQTNPSVFLDQLWLRFDIARRVYMTVGRQKVRWGVSRVWYPTDFLNSQPRDALNPFDVRLGVNMIKAHVPIESLGWNFYGYGLLDAVNPTSLGETIDQLGGALRGEFVFGPAEVGVGGIWHRGRRPRYAVDVSSAVGPFDVYAEAALRDARDFLKFRYPSDLTEDTLLSQLGQIEAYRPQGLLVQASGGVSYQFNYTDKNFAVVGAEYFYNPAGYVDPVEYQVQTFAPSLVGQRPDPIQQTALYGGQHNLAVTVAAPGLPELSWITLSLSNILILNDPSGLTRIDASFRVLSYLTVQAFAAVFYGQTGGQLRFKLSSQVINDIANVSELGQPGSGATVRSNLAPLRFPGMVQAGVLLRLSI